MEESGEENLNQDVEEVEDDAVALPSVQSDLPMGRSVSANLPPVKEVAHSSTTEPYPYPFVSDRIAELRQMCIKPPPNRTITKSDPIPFPPDWPGHLPANRLNKSSSVTSDSSSSKGDKSSSKKPGILSRTMSFLRGKRSEPSTPSPQAPSTSSQSSSKANPSLSVLVPRHRQMSLSTDTTQRESSLTFLPSKRSATPSGGCTSSDMWAEDAFKSDVVQLRDSSAKQKNK